MKVNKWRKVYAILKLMLSRKKIVSILDDYNNKGFYPTIENFVSYLLREKRIYNWFSSCRKGDKEKESEIDSILGDCIEGKLEYIGYIDKERTKLRVATDGRTFISGGWWKEFLSHPIVVANFTRIVWAVIVLLIVILVLALRINLGSIMELMKTFKTILVC